MLQRVEMTNKMHVSNVSNPVFDALRSEFRKHFPQAQSTGIWPAWTWWGSGRNWDDTVLKLIHFEPNAFDDELMAVIEKLRETARGFITRLKNGVSDFVPDADLTE